MSEKPERLISYTDPADTHMIDTGIPGYQVPVVNAVLRLKPESTPEQPIGFVLVDHLLEGDEREQVKQEVQAMMDAYDGSVSFPKHAKQYIWTHSSQWDYHTFAQPPNDPRSEPAPKHEDGTSDTIKAITHLLEKGLSILRSMHCIADTIKVTVRPQHVFRERIVQIDIKTDIPYEIWYHFLSPERALSLLAQLERERETLERLVKAKEERHDR